MTRKNLQRSQIFCIGEGPAEMGWSSSIPGKSKRTTQVWKLLDCETWQGKDISWTLTTKMQGQTKIYEAHFGGGLEKEISHQLRRWNQQTGQNYKKIQGLCLLSLFPNDILFFFVQLTWVTQLSYSLFSPDDYLQIAVMNKLLC